LYKNTTMLQSSIAKS